MRPFTAYVLLALCVLFWSGNVITVRALKDDIPPLTLAFWRWLVAVGILLPFVARDLRARWPRVRADLARLVPAGILGMAVYSGCVYVGLQSTTATNTALINATLPVMIVGLGGMFDRRGLAVVKALGVALSLCGVATIVLNGDLASVAALALNPGDLWVLLAVCAFVVYTVVFRGGDAGLPPGVYLVVTMSIAALVLLPLHLWELAYAPTARLSANAAAGLVYLAVGPSILSYLFWMKGVAVVGAARTGMFLYLMPVFTTVLAIAFLGEVLSGYHAVGSGLIVAGIWLAGRNRRARGREG